MRVNKKIKIRACVGSNIFFIMYVAIINHENGSLGIPGAMGE
jgi:hypothetical protein